MGIDLYKEKQDRVQNGDGDITPPVNLQFISDTCYTSRRRKVSIVINEDDIDTIMREIGVTRETAIETLTYYYGDLVSSLADLSVS
jgi:NACalpha-BTF3-like transcription factor